MANSTMPKDNSVQTGHKEITTNVDFYRRGNVCMILANSISITDTVNPTLLGTVPSGCEPPTRIYGRGVGASGTGYVRVDSNGKVYGYRSVAGVLNASATYGIV